MARSPARSPSKKATPIRVQVAPKSTLAASDDTANPLDDAAKKGQLLGMELDMPSKCGWLFERPKDDVPCSAKGTALRSHHMYENLQVLLDTPIPIAHRSPVSSTGRPFKFWHLFLIATFSSGLLFFMITALILRPEVTRRQRVFDDYCSDEILQHALPFQAGLPGAQCVCTGRTNSSSAFSAADAAAAQWAVGNTTGAYLHVLYGTYGGVPRFGSVTSRPLAGFKSHGVFVSSSAPTAAAVANSSVRAVCGANLGEAPEVPASELPILLYGCDVLVWPYYAASVPRDAARARLDRLPGSVLPVPDAASGDSARTSASQTVNVTAAACGSPVVDMSPTSGAYFVQTSSDVELDDEQGSFLWTPQTLTWVCASDMPRPQEARDTSTASGWLWESTSSPVCSLQAGPAAFTVSATVTMVAVLNAIAKTILRGACGRKSKAPEKEVDDKYAFELPGHSYGDGIIGTVMAAGLAAFVGVALGKLIYFPDICAGTSNTARWNEWVFDASGPVLLVPLVSLCASLADDLVLASGRVPWFVPAPVGQARMLGLEPEQVQTAFLPAEAMCMTLLLLLLTLVSIPQFVAGMFVYFGLVMGMAFLSIFLGGCTATCTVCSVTCLGMGSHGCLRLFCSKKCADSTIPCFVRPVAIEEAFFYV